MSLCFVQKKMKVASMMISVLEFPSSGDAEQTFRTVEELEQHLRDIDSSDSRKNRMYLVENASPKLVHILTERFDIDPTLFESYRYAPNPGDLRETRMLRQLPSRRKETTWYTLHYREVLDLASDAPLIRDSHILTQGVVPREISTHVHFTPIKKETNVTGTVRRNVSLWYSQPEGVQHWNGMETSHAMAYDRLSNKLQHSRWSTLRSGAMYRSRIGLTRTRTGTFGVLLPSHTLVDTLTWHHRPMQRKEA
jgi:hypothetical protein